MSEEQDKIRLLTSTSDEPRDFEVVKEKTRFDDVGGLEELKKEIKMKIIYPFQYEEIFKAYEKKVGGGILLYGPPGCGKTFIAKATAGECNASFINIGIHEILDMWYGNSEKNLHEAFETARRNIPAVIFFDEIDAIGGSRTSSREHHSRVLTNQLLSETDSIASNNEKILIIGATNAPWFIDPALKRPGRFDRIIFVGPPDIEARTEIIKIHLKGKPTTEDIDILRIARVTHGYSGADIKNLVETATEGAINEAIKTGEIKKITTEDLINASKKCKETISEWIANAKNYAKYSNESGMYDPILKYLDKASIYITEDNLCEKGNVH